MSTREDMAQYAGIGVARDSVEHGACGDCLAAVTRLIETAGARSDLEVGQVEWNGHVWCECLRGGKLVILDPTGQQFTSLCAQVNSSKGTVTLQDDLLHAVQTGVFHPAEYQRFMVLVRTAADGPDAARRAPIYAEYPAGQWGLRSGSMQGRSAPAFELSD